MPQFRAFTPEELKFVSNFKRGELVAEPGSVILAEGAHSAQLFTLLSGWVFRYKTLEDGRRQILNYCLPGDLVGLQGSVIGAMEHSVEALSPAVLCVFQRDRLAELYRSHPGLSFDVTWLASREEQLIDQNLVSVGRRTALERIAYLLLHLFVRAEESGLTKGNTIQFPFTQQHIADTLGMSLVHTNKTLKRLLQSNAVRWKDRVFELVDRASLVEIAGEDVKLLRPRPFI